MSGRRQTDGSIWQKLVDGVPAPWGSRFILCNNNRTAVSDAEMEISYHTYLKQVWTLRDLKWMYENDAFDVLGVVTP